MVSPIAVVGAEINLSIDDEIGFFLALAGGHRRNDGGQYQRHTQENGPAAKPFQVHPIDTPSLNPDSNGRRAPPVPGSPVKMTPASPFPTMPGFYPTVG
jgi:hypothetical protein